MNYRPFLLNVWGGVSLGSAAGKVPPSGRETRPPTRPALEVFHNETPLLQ